MPALPTYLVVRPPTIADVQAIFTLWAASDLAEIGEVDCEEGDIVEDLTRPRLDLERDYWVVADSERLVGAASVLDRISAEVADGDLVADPDADPAVGPHLLELLERRAAEQAAAAGRASLLVTVHCTTTNTRRMDELSTAGYTGVRRFSRMVADLDDVPPPAGGGVRPASGPADRPAMHAVMTASFADHFGSTPEPYDAWWARQSGRSGFDESLWWLAEADGAAVGALIGRNMAEQGWVQGLGVLPAYRGRGLARRLLLASFEEFRRRGYTRVALRVDTGNETGALRLYESVGMRPAQQHDVWQRMVPAGTGPT